MSAWYVSRSGDATGPFSTDMLLEMLRKSQLQPLDLVFREGEVEWRPVATFRELKRGASSSEPPSPVSRSVSAADQAPTPAKPREESRALSWIVLKPYNSTYLQEGPLETQAIIDGLEQGRFQFSQYAWHSGMNQWMRIGDLRQFDRRSRSRESRPHVPPPLPDPIAAVMLEDDRDLEAEEFHITMRGALKHDLTPNPLESMQAITQLGNAAIGGAAAESPEQKATRAVSLVVSSGNLAGVPWERDASDGYAQAVELVDDQHSGVHSDFLDDGAEDFSFTGSIGQRGNGEPAKQLSKESFEERLERTPPPILPSAPVPFVKDNWDRWGRHAAGAVMIGIVGLFGWHLATYKAPTLAVAAAPIPASAAATPVVSTAESPVVSEVAPAVVDDFGKDAPDADRPRVRAAIEKPALPVVASKELSLVGLKLDRPDGQILVQGSFPPNVPIEVTFKGRLGQILSKLSIRKTIEVPRKNGEIPSLRLKNLRLPAGAYTVEVKVAEASAKNEFFFGTRDAKFLDKLETHLREISLETQTQKKVLFYAAQELNVLARDLGQNYGQLRGKPELWNAFYSRWKQQMEQVSRSLADVRRKSTEDQAYPEETSSLVLAHSNLKDVGSQFAQAIGQSRDMASDALTELISELTRQKDVIGQATARPASGASDEKL